jgi:hypothetical protein
MLHKEFFCRFLKIGYIWKKSEYMRSTRLLNVYGIALALTAVAALAIIGVKTRNLMLTCFLFSLSAILLAKLNQKGNLAWIDILNCLLPTSAFILFAYRAAINFLALIGIVQHELDHYDAYSKCLNLIFLIFLASGSLTTALIMFAKNNHSSEN